MAKITKLKKNIFFYTDEYHYLYCIFSCTQVFYNFLVVLTMLFWYDYV